MKPLPWRLHAKGITSIGILWTMYQVAWRDDEKITWEDFPELVGGTSSLGVLWIPEVLAITAVSTLPLVVLEAAIVVGAVASIAIAGEEGLETYVDYISNPQEILFDEEKRDAFVMAAGAIYAIANPLNIPSKMAGEWLGENLLWGELVRSRWVTGPVMPW